MRPSLGFSRLAIGFILLAASLPGAEQPTVEVFGVGKRRDYLQNSPATPTSHVILSNPSGPFAFSAYVSGTNLDLVSPKKITLPNATELNLTGDASFAGYDAPYTTQTGLDAGFPNTSYPITLGGSVFSISLGSTNAYPAEIPSLTAGTWDSQGRLTVNAATGATLSFASFGSYAAGAGGLVSFDLYTLSGGLPATSLASVSSVSLTGYSTDPLLTSYTVPANLLQPDQVYYAELSFSRVATLDTSALPAVGVALFTTTTGIVISTSTPAGTPTFTTQPQSVTVTAGGSATFNVLATGNPAPTYQWQKDGINLPGATATSLTLSNVQLANAGTYTAVATNSVSSVTSSGATLTVTSAGSAPTFFTQPLSQNVPLGATATFTVDVRGTAPLTYQWRKNGVNLANDSTVQGATTASLQIADVRAGASGSYTVFVSNAFGSATSSSAILTVDDLSGVIAVSTSTYHSLFVRANGTLWGMGTSGYGELGDQTPLHATPTLIAAGVVAAWAGDQHSVFLKSDGSLWTMGRNADGQLGDGTTTDRASPVQIATGVAAASAGERTTLFVKKDGTLWATGAGYYGELATGAADVSVAPKLAVRGVTSVSAGRDFCLFVKWDSSLWGAGSNYSGQLGDGTNLNQRYSPIQITSSVASASAGYRSSAFIKLDGTAWTMGFNSVGQLGDGTTIDRSRPVGILGNAAHVSAGREHSLFLKADGSLSGTGSNFSGQLGDGSLTSRLSPVLSTGGVAAVSAGLAQSLYCRSDGSLWGMGYNGGNQLGLTPTGPYPTPVRITLGSLTVPPSVSLLTAEQDSQYPQPVRLTWNHVLGANTYEVWRNTTNLSASAVRIATTSAPLCYDPAAAPRNTYFYWVKAGNGAGFSALSQSAQINVAAPPAVSADFNADGKPDLIWSNSKTGERALWLMNGTNFLAASTLGIFPLEWTIAATGDFNADGKPDLVWSNSLTGERALWLMNGTNLLGVSTLGTFPLEWTVAATADFNADGKPDIIWSNSITGERAIWLMNGTNFLGASTLGTFPLEWTVAATGDFNADGKPDLVWSNSLTGERALWLMDGTTRIGVSTLGLFPLEWTVAGTADFNADSKPDIIWSNSITGERALWLMNGTNFLSASTLGIFPLEWTVSN